MSHNAHVEAQIREDGGVVINLFQNDEWIAGGLTGHNYHRRVCSEEDFWGGVHDHAKQVASSKGLHVGRFMVR